MRDYTHYTGKTVIVNSTNRIAQVIAVIRTDVLVFFGNEITPTLISAKRVSLV